LGFYGKVELWTFVNPKMDPRTCSAAWLSKLKRDHTAGGYEDKTVTVDISESRV